MTTPDDRYIWSCVAVIPTHPARGSASDPTTLLGRAVASVLAGRTLPFAYEIATDHGGNGAAHTRQAALNAALRHGTKWVTFLDSDDVWLPNHLEVHRRLLEGENGDEDLGDVAYSWFTGNSIALEWEKTHRGKAWDPAAPHHTTMTITVRSDFARRATFLRPEGDMHPDWTGEDWFWILQLNEMGARFVGSPEVTWRYEVHGGNTSGSPRRGDAAR